MYRAVTLAALDAGVDSTTPTRWPRSRAAPTSSSSDGVTHARRPRRVAPRSAARRSPAAVSTVSAPPGGARGARRPAAGVGGSSTAAAWSRGATSAPSCSPTRRVKVFLTASDDERARRRRQRDEAAAAPRRRGRRGARRARPRVTEPTHARARAPARGRRADDAIVIDTTDVDVDDVDRRDRRPVSDDACGESHDLLPVRPRRRARRSARSCSGCASSGNENVPPTGAYIVAPSHRSILDVPFAAFVTNAHVRFMAKDELFQHPVGRRLFTALGAVRSSAAPPTAAPCAAARSRARARASRWRMFPEGTRRARPRDRASCSTGAAYLAVKLGVPIVPVGIGGSEQILPRGKMLPRLAPGRGRRWASRSYPPRARGPGAAQRGDDC